MNVYNIYYYPKICFIISICLPDSIATRDVRHFFSSSIVKTNLHSSNESFLIEDFGDLFRRISQASNFRNAQLKEDEISSEPSAIVINLILSV